MRHYLFGNLGGEDVASKDVGKVQCPIWQCGGSLYLKSRRTKVDNDSAWQMPDIVCDNCGTVFVNTLRTKLEAEWKDREQDIRSTCTGMRQK